MRKQDSMDRAAQAGRGIPGRRVSFNTASKNSFLHGTGAALLALAIAVLTLFNGPGIFTSHGEEGTPRLIRYENLEELVKAYSPQVQMEQAQYDRRLGRYENAREEIMTTRRLLREEAEDMEKEGDISGAESYRAQAKTLEDTVKELDKQIRFAKGSASAMSLRKMEDTVTWTAQSLMGTYHSLKLEQAVAAAQAELKQSLYEKAGRQLAQGAVSQSEAEEAGQAASDAAAQAQGLWDQMERVRTELAILLGYENGQEIEIAAMPVPDSTRAEGMELEADKWRALGNNYELRAERGTSFSGTNKELHSRQRSIEQNEGNMYGQVETMYQDVLANRTAWYGAVTAMAAADAKWQADSHKMELGMLSNQEFLEAKAAYLEAAAAKGRADVTFQQAMDTYDWAVKGLIQ